MDHAEETTVAAGPAAENGQPDHAVSAPPDHAAGAPADHAAGTPPEHAPAPPAEAAPAAAASATAAEASPGPVAAEAAPAVSAAEAIPAPAAAEARPVAAPPEAAPTPASVEAASTPVAAAATSAPMPVHYGAPAAYGYGSSATHVVTVPAPVAPAAPAPATAPRRADAAPAARPQRAPGGAPKPPPAVDERRARAQAAWERVVAARESGETLTGNVTAAVKGGLLVDVGGIRGFLPASQTRVEQGTAIESLVKTKVPLKVIDVDTGRRRIVVSHRRAVQDERRAKRSELLKSLAIGQVREGVVVRLADFGAFVDLGGIDGLIPMRELAFERIDKASDVVKIGERLPVEVIRIEEGGKKIALSRRNALPDPWRDHARVLKQGASVEGKVVAKDPRLQVELAPGVVGSVRENDANPADYEIGEAIEVIVRRVDRATRRITLSTQHALPPQPQQQHTSSGFAPLGIELGRRK